MRSYIPFLLCASGCHLIIVLDPPAEAACGPFGDPSPLTFDITLTDVKYFTRRETPTAGDPDLGTVLATRANTGTKVYVVQRQPDTDTWILSPNRNGPTLLANTAGGSMGEIDFAKTDEIFVWLEETATMNRTPYQASSGTGGYNINRPLFGDVDYHLSIGNVVEVLEEVAGNPPTLRSQRKRGVFTKEPDDGVGKNQIVFADDTPPYGFDPWEEVPARTEPINADPDINPGRGVITNDTFILVYAAKFKNGDSNLYASRRDDTTKNWNPGLPIDDLNTGMDETDPWINHDCSEIYFSRGGVVYRAARVAE
jgi:hypothetical protein